MKNVYVGVTAWDMGFDAHVTIMYLGDLDNERYNYLNGVLRNWVNAYDYRNFADYAERRRLDMFGPSKDLPVLRVRVSDGLKHLRGYLEIRGIEDNSGYEHWCPHISLKRDRLEQDGDIHLPKIIKLTGIYLGSKEFGHDPITPTY